MNRLQHLTETLFFAILISTPILVVGVKLREVRSNLLLKSPEIVSGEWGDIWMEPTLQIPVYQEHLRVGKLGNLEWVLQIDKGKQKGLLSAIINGRSYVARMAKYDYFTFLELMDLEGKLIRRLPVSMLEEGTLHLDGKTLFGAHLYSEASTPIDRALQGHWNFEFSDLLGGRPEWPFGTEGLAIQKGYDLYHILRKTVSFMSDGIEYDYLGAYRTYPESLILGCMEMNLWFSSERRFFMSCDNSLPTSEWTTEIRMPDDTRLQKRVSGGEWIEYVRYSPTESHPDEGDAE